MRPSTIAALAALVGCAAPGGTPTTATTGTAPTFFAPGTPTETGPEGFPVGEDRCPQFTDGIPCIDVDAIAPSWTHDPELYDAVGIDLPGDLDGDGDLDAAVMMHAPDGDRTYVVFGPLNRTLVLPDDADMTFLAHVAFTDLTGDGVLDGQIETRTIDSARGFDVIAGPFSGAEIDPAGRVIASYEGGAGVDLDVNGTLDRWQYDNAARVTSVWLGGWSTWSGAPTFTVTDSCWAVLDAPSVSGPYFDFDGDGVVLMDMNSTNFSDVTMNDWVSECAGEFRVPSTVTGTIDLRSSAEVIVGDANEPDRRIEDQDGDGDPEWISGGALLAGPLASDGTGTPLLASVHGDFADSSRIVPMSVDYDRDGILDLWYIDPDPREGLESLLLLRGGLGGGLVTGTTDLRLLGLSTFELFDGGAGDLLVLGESYPNGQLFVADFPQ